MITIHDKSGKRFDTIQPERVVDIATTQIRGNSSLRRWFDDRLRARGNKIDDLLVGAVEVPVYILEQGDDFWNSPGQTRWDGVFSAKWAGQADRSIALASGLFEPDILDSDKQDRREAAAIFIHELAHWVEAYALNMIWPDRPKNKGTDTGDYVAKMIKW